MSKSKVLVLSIFGIIVHVALALSAYLISRSTIGVAGTVPSLTHRPTQTITPTASPTDGHKGGRGESGTPTPTPGTTATATDDHGGRCSEAEHSSDPSCSSDSSGKGGGGGDDDSSSNSGKGGGDD